MSTDWAHGLWTGSADDLALPYLLGHPLGTAVTTVL